MALVVVVAADLHSGHDSVFVPSPARPPRMAAQVSPPEPMETPEPRTRPVPNPTRQPEHPTAPHFERRLHRAHPRQHLVEPQRLTATHAPPAPKTRARVAGLRLAQRSTTGSSAPAVTPAAPAGIRVASTHRVAGSATRTGRVLPASYAGPPRPQKNPVTRPVTPSPAPAPAVAPPVEVAAVEPPRPKARPEARRKPAALAWGNPEFHYGSGYDIYSMHLDPDPE
jgi:hypothetical protein